MLLSTLHDNLMENINISREQFSSLLIRVSRYDLWTLTRDDLQLAKSLWSLPCSARDAMASSSASPVGTLYC
jgi:hypothetical protein